jgi:hypothetical protein
MTPNPNPTLSSHALPSTISMPRLDDDAVIQIHDFIHQVLDLFEARYGDQIRRFYEDLGGQDMLPGIDNLDDPPF